ncbi:Digeranylgeranylglycerophospholipid reductase [Candidatus Bilamarchaeum dharawalense]|uniref:Digeranylgeranylglycerophospholipid reductase n=1 Tax=Candidatus Bilamarchaeum dharawalense TaxID=2885759 RepID=A0A5E4LT35_9ARCH|nr:Digeranylgeranylglycerophospholipid reductase [Candidatus Bilamarchaeum dharawalense]
MADVHIVGAGPAGAISALSAIHHGHQVVISEDHPVSGLPENCSGLFSIDGLGSLKQFVDFKPTIINPIYGANIHINDTILSVRTQTPVAHVCNRSHLDVLLAQNAETEGAKINYGERIQGNFHANNIIGADGPLSHVARHFNFPKIKKFAATLQADLPFRCEDPRVVELFLSNQKFPGFFAWTIPHNEEKAEFGVGVEVPSRAQEAWKNLLKLKKIEAAVKPSGASIPLETRSKTAKSVSGKNIFLVGDAAGQVKSTTGGGVIFGGNCAALLGKHISNPGGYELEWRLKYGTDLALHSLFHNYLANQSDASLSALGRRLKKLNIDVYLSKNGHMDRPTKMVGPNLMAHLLKSILGV